MVSMNWWAAVIYAQSGDRSLSATNVVGPASMPARWIFDLSKLALPITAAIFLGVFSLIACCAIKFRSRRQGDGREPAPVYGSNQGELAWTIVPVLIVLALLHDHRSSEERQA